MPITTPTFYPDPWAADETLVPLTPAQMAAGYPAGSDEKPSRQSINNALQYAVNGVLYYLTTGVPAWSATATYQMGAIVTHGGRYYASLYNNSINQPPGSSAWTELLWLQSVLDARYALMGGAASFATCNVANSPVRTFANSPDGGGTGGMIWPEFGVAVSNGSEWGTSIDPAALAYVGTENNFAGTQTVDGAVVCTGWRGPLDVSAPVVYLSCGSPDNPSRHPGVLFVLPSPNTDESAWAISAWPDDGSGSGPALAFGTEDDSGNMHSWMFVNRTGATASNVTIRPPVLFERGIVTYSATTSDQSVQATFDTIGPTPHPNLRMGCWNKGSNTLGGFQIDGYNSDLSRTITWLAGFDDVSGQHLWAAGVTEFYLGGQFRMQGNVNGNLAVQNGGIQLCWNLSAGAGEACIVNSYGAGGNGGVAFYNVKGNQTLTNADKPILWLDPNQVAHMYGAQSSLVFSSAMVADASGNQPRLDLGINATSGSTWPGSFAFGTSNAQASSVAGHTLSLNHYTGETSVSPAVATIVSFTRNLTTFHSSVKTAAIDLGSASYSNPNGVVNMTQMLLYGGLPGNGNFVGFAQDGDALIAFQKTGNATGGLSIGGWGSNAGIRIDATGSTVSIYGNTGFGNDVSFSGSSWHTDGGSTQVTISPQYFYVNMTTGAAIMQVNGSFVVYGGGKNFAVPHPLDETKDLYHATLEGPENGVFYRGEVVLVDGAAEVILPDYFEPLTFLEDRSVLLTQVDDDKALAILAASRIVDGKFRIRSSVPDATVAWEVKAVRRIGVGHLVVTQRKHAPAPQPK